MKKYLSVVLFILVLALSMAANISAVETETEQVPTITVSSKKGYIGKTVDVTISISDNPGVMNVGLAVDYDQDVFTLTGVEDGGILGTNYFEEDYTKCPYILNWANNLYNEYENGVIATLTFEVNADAEEGVYPITVTYDNDNDDILNEDLETVEFDIVNGSVTVRDYIVGDISGDLKVTSRDTAYLARYIANWEGYGEEDVVVQAGDVNASDTVTALDTIILARHIAKWTGYETLPYGVTITPDRSSYKLVYVESDLRSVAVGSAEDFDLENGEEDLSYFKYPANNGEAYTVSTFANVDEMYVDSDYRKNFGSVSMPCGVYLLNADNIVVDHICEEDFVLGINYLYDLNYDFAFYVNTTTANEISLYDYNSIRFTGDDLGQYGFDDTTNIQTVKFRFLENDGITTYRVDKSNESIYEYTAANTETFTAGADETLYILAAPNTYSGYDPTVPFPSNTFSGIVYRDDQIVDFYTIKYITNGIWFATATFCVGTDATIITSVPTNDGCTFVGWNTASDGSGTFYAAGDTYTGNVNITLYAQWNGILI